MHGKGSQLLTFVLATFHLFPPLLFTNHASTEDDQLQKNPSKATVLLRAQSMTRNLAKTCAVTCYEEGAEDVQLKERKPFLQVSRVWPETECEAALLRQLQGYYESNKANQDRPQGFRVTALRNRCFSEFE